jgi:transcriptional regulator with XRE-family HTH domain
MRLKIDLVRSSKGLTQEQLANMVGISRPQLTLLEQGKRRLHVEMQKKIADALDVAPEDLIDYEGPDKEEIDLIVSAFVKLTPEQRKSWLDMARVVCA